MVFEISTEFIADANASAESEHRERFEALGAQLSRQGIDAEAVAGELAAFQVAAPSWALGTGGTRFGRFPEAGEPRSIEEKLDDVATLNRLTASKETLTLIPRFDVGDALSRAIRNGHRVVITLGRADGASSTAITVPRLGQEDATKALVA